MPNRTEKAAALIKSLPIKAADSICNARTPSGYCKMPAGFRTDHVGEGRCYLHGGRAGKPITHGMYSKKLGSTLKAEYDKMVTDPNLLDLHGELAFVKTMMGNFIDSIQSLLDGGVNIWVAHDRFDTPIMSPQAKALIKLLETITKLFRNISDVENSNKNNLNIKQVYNIIQQISFAMGESCGECPIRGVLANKLKNVKAPVMHSDGS